MTEDVTVELNIKLEAPIKELIQMQRSLKENQIKITIKETEKDHV
jgi:hypothetical protein